VLDINLLILPIILGVLFLGYKFLMVSTKKKTKFGVNVEDVYCPVCNSLQPKIRKPANLRQALWGGYTCHCGCEMDKYGFKINPAGWTLLASRLLCGRYAYMELKYGNFFVKR